MASVGRGRGWAKAADRESNLRRPGQSSDKKSELDEIINKIYDLSIEETPLDRLSETVSFVKARPDALSAENLDKLWKLALDDRCFGIKFVKFYKTDYQKVENRPREIVKFVLTSLQAGCEGRKELHKENPSRLTNLTWLMGTVLGEENKGGTVVAIIGHALLTCLAMLLDTATEDDIETVAYNLLCCGKSIAKNHDSTGKLEITAILVRIAGTCRKIIVKSNVSVRSRALLLLIIDFSNRQYEPFDGDLQVFYMNALEPSRTADSDREFNQQACLHRLLAKGMDPMKNKNQSVGLQEASRKKSDEQALKVDRSEVSSGPFPRAIRGSGASENSSRDHRNEKKSPRGHQEKLTDEQVWSAKQNISSKVWGHDDRFENDYE